MLNNVQQMYENSICQSSIFFKLFYFQFLFCSINTAITDSLSLQLILFRRTEGVFLSTENLQFTEYSELDGTHKDHRSPCLGSAQEIPGITPCAESDAQTLELCQAGTVTLGSLFLMSILNLS